MNNMETLVEMLRYKRPHRSKTERKFIRRFVSQLGDVTYDKMGNRYKKIGDAPIMYSCHTDTVHKSSGHQNIAVRGTDLVLAKKESSNCLGADNTAGLWLMREMILQNKPGLYIFHRGEECGGIGSKWIAKYNPDAVKDIKAAIAFDRRGTKSIITHQWGGRCCSNEFAVSLSKELKLGHIGDDGGSFTDTASYTGLIPECTNVSVGYQSEHSNSESLDMSYLIELRQAMLDYNWENLVIKRKAGEYEPKTYAYSGKKNYYYGYESFNDDYGPFYRSKWNKKHKPGKKGKYTYVYDKETNKSKLVYRVVDKNEPDEGVNRTIGFLPAPVKDNAQGELLPDAHELDENDRPGKAEYRKEQSRTLVLQMVMSNPSLIVHLLEDYGVYVDDVADYIASYHGIIPHELYSKNNAEDY